MGAAMRTIAMACLALTLAGCGLVDREAAAKRAAARAETLCRAAGLNPSSEKWTDCILQMMAAERGRAVTVQDDRRGMSFMCKDAISRSDSGAVFIFC